MSGVRAARSRMWLRLLLAWIAVSAVVPGAWAALATDAFHRSFPLGAPGWVAPLGPASPHLTADVGAFYLAFALMFVWAAWRPSRELVVPLICGWTVFSVLHLGWHAANTTPFGTGDAVAQLMALAVVVVAPSLALRLLAGAAAVPRAGQRAAEPVLATGCATAGGRSSRAGRCTLPAGRWPYPSDSGATDARRSGSLVPWRRNP